MRKDITIEKLMLGGEKVNKSELARQYGCCWETIDRRLNPDKYKKDKIEDTVMQGILFKKQYWLASRCTHTRSEPNSANFLIRIVWNSSNVSAHLVPRGSKLPSSSTKNRISNSTYSNYKS